jgi:predicted GTPase
MGTVVYAGVDYGKILEQAQAEADVVVWDGGNNDTPFYIPDLWITVADPLRPGHELRYYPGETNLRRADVVVINKATVARPEDVEIVESNTRSVNPEAGIVLARSKLSMDDPDKVRGKSVLAVEDGPTLTHGEMPFGAAGRAAEQFGASEVVDPHVVAVGSIKATFKKYPHLGRALPAMGYSQEQVSELEKTINAVECDTVLFATPIDLAKIVKIDKPTARVRYELDDINSPTLGEHLDNFLEQIG